MKMSNKIAAHNAGWPSQFRFAVSVSWSGVCELARSPKHMLRTMVFLLGFLLVPIAAPSAGTNDMDWLAKMIACDEKDEQYVAQAYDAFLTLVAGREIQPTDLRFPSRLVERSGEFIHIERAYYISPNEFRGFDLFIPKALISEKDGFIVPRVPLAVAKRLTRQGMTSFTLREANKAVQRTGASRSAGETNGTSSAAGSRR
jgi:hypothetical protein